MNIKCISWRSNQRDWSPFISELGAMWIRSPSSFLFFLLLPIRSKIFFQKLFFIFNNIFSFYLALLFVVDIKHSRKCFLLLYIILFWECKFFRCVKGWREVHVHLTPRIYVIRRELFLCAYVFFPFSLTRMTPTSVVQWPLFQILLINEKSISILLKSNTVDFILEIVCVCVIWIKEKIRCIKMLMMHLTLFRF